MSGRGTFDDIAAFVSRYAPGTDADIVAYSVLFGGYDRPPAVAREAGIDFVLFTDRPEMVPTPWRAIAVDPARFGAQRTGRYFKCLGHRVFPGARSVYFDASFTLLHPLAKLIDDHRDTRFALFRHADHDDIEPEADACISQRKEDPTILKAQVMRYREAGLPIPSGCYATGVLLRAHADPAVADAMECWCTEIAGASVRDQISLPYVLWRTGLRPDMIRGSVFYNSYLVPRPHAGASVRARLKRATALQLYRLRLLHR